GYGLGGLSVDSGLPRGDAAALGGAARGARAEGRADRPGGEGLLRAGPPARDRPPEWQGLSGSDGRSHHALPPPGVVALLAPRGARVSREGEPMSRDSPRTIVAHVRDLLFSSRIAETARRLGYPFRAARSLEDLR